MKKVNTPKKRLYQKLGRTIATYINDIRSDSHNLWIQFLVRYPEDLVLALRRYFFKNPDILSEIDASLLPKEISGFHDFSYLFARHFATRNIISMDIDEAAYLWKIVTENRPTNILEIGRFRGGSTILLCAAASLYPGGNVLSIDLKEPAWGIHDELILEEHLKRLGLNNYRLEITSSQNLSSGSIFNFGLIDGDHSTEGVRRDFLNLVKYVVDDADILFHDSCAARKFATPIGSVVDFVSQLKHDSQLTFRAEIGSLTHFKFIASKKSHKESAHSLLDI